MGVKERIKRILLGLIGLVIGVSFGILSILLVFYFLSEFFNLNLIPRGPGYIVILITFGIFGFNVLYKYEKFKEWNIFSLERKFDRLRIVFVGMWFIISVSCIYFFTRDFRYIDFLRDWGTREWRVFKIVVIPMFIIFIGFPVYERLKKWIDSGK
ncbi:MAG: hypothetical protein VX976_02705 [Pseudomonadota bacterium]|nr:hypothetical protein [Pseudomonadota bacterium]